MNDLTDLREGWGQPEPPSPAAYSAARDSLMRQAMTAPAAVAGPAQETVAGRSQRRVRAARFQRRRAGWLAGAAGLTAAAATAVAAVMGGVGATTTHGAGGNPLVVSHLSARQILLDAASIAAAAPARTGKYWYTKIDYPPPQGGVTQTWYAHNGLAYVLLPDHTVYQPPFECGFSLAGQLLTYEQIKRLPTDPAALKAWYIRAVKQEVLSLYRTHGMATYPPSCPQPKPVHAPPHTRLPAKPDLSPPSNSEIADGLSVLLAQIPAPPAVRAAAFRVLATTPGVKKAGYTDGDVVLAIYVGKIPASKFLSGKAPRGDNGIEKLIIDPTTFTLQGEIAFDSTFKLLASGWTNHLPPISRSYR